jgi:hypothetical protein
MKKALEAGIEFCNKNINYKYNPDDNLDNTVWEDYLRSYIAIHHVLKVMLKALDDEPENPEPQRSVDWDVFKSLVKSWFCSFQYKPMNEFMKENESQWLKTKPAIDPEIKRVYDHWKKNDGIVVIERAFEREMWNCIKAHCEGK